MDLTEYFYSEVVGHAPETYEDEATTRHTLAYLEESGLFYHDIILMMENFADVGVIRQDSLPEQLWEGSLTKKDVYYYSHILWLQPPTSKLNLKTGKYTVYPFYKEMKARFTMTDLIDFFYKVTKADIRLRNDKRQGGAFRSMLTEYEGLRESGIEPLDLILSMITEAGFQRLPILDVFDLKNFSLPAIQVDKLWRLNNESCADKKNRIIWRSYLINEKGEITWQKKL